jgi:hypothetical protein
MAPSKTSTRITTTKSRRVNPPLACFVTRFIQGTFAQLRRRIKQKSAGASAKAALARPHSLTCRQLGRAP